ncbi:hypothetical protein [Francisella philomiragia]|uniref:hypothetical protein n=1 Tax=Francisella philomiragia TaxID=28110 RepID=UPI001B8AA84E|nr:hypothetical protein [Francisella philomiragia]QUE32395.1 hypothetical protein IMS64_09650 [Francisella philomiragia]
MCTVFIVIIVRIGIDSLESAGILIPFVIGIIFLTLFIRSPRDKRRNALNAYNKYLRNEEYRRIHDSEPW